MFASNPAIEAPPAIYASGPTQTGRTQQLELQSPAQVDYLCSLVMGPTKQEHQRYWTGCYNVRTDMVIVPAKGAWPSEKERQALIAHEWAHARGWRHNADGRGTSSTLSLPPKGAASGH